MVEDKGTTPPVGTSTPILGVFEGSSQNYAKDVIIFRLRWTIKESGIFDTPGEATDYLLHLTPPRMKLTEYNALS